jgi:hypothetical protein
VAAVGALMMCVGGLVARINLGPVILRSENCRERVGPSEMSKCVEDNPYALPFQVGAWTAAGGCGVIVLALGFAVMRNLRK